MLHEEAEASEPCLYPDLESGTGADTGTINVLEHSGDLTDFTEDDEEVSLPMQTPSLMMSRSEPLPQKSRQEASPLTPDIPHRARCSTNPELSSTKDKTHRKHSQLLSAFASYMDGVLPFLRRTNSDAPPVPLFLCAICLENHAIDDSFALQGCPAKHSFCRDSMDMYLSSQISDGAVTTLKCPCFGMDGCDAVFSALEVQSVVDQACFEQYSRLLEIKTNPNARECPSCSKFATTGSEESPEITCHECGTQFCYLHNNAHPSLSCQEYIRRTAKTDMRSVATIRATSRTCPKCKVPTQKISGCNHMTCQNCHEDWCWLCGRHMEDGHYEGFSSCSGQQFGAASPFALWNFFPCLRWPCFAFVNTALHMLALCCLCIILFAFACASLPLSLVLCPFSLLLIFFTSGDSVLFFVPALCGMALLCSAFMLSLQIVYLPFPILVTLIKLLLNGCNCCAENYVPCQTGFSEMFGDVGEAPILELWFYPLYLVRSLLPFGDDDD